MHREKPEASWVLQGDVISRFALLIAPDAIDAADDYGILALEVGALDQGEKPDAPRGRDRKSRKQRLVESPRREPEFEHPAQRRASSRSLFTEGFAVEGHLIRNSEKEC
jgi:hypothetical protein